MWSNFHGHSNYCDGKGTIADYAQQAEELNMISLGISSHAPLPFPCKWCMKSSELNSYLDSITKVQHENRSVEIYKGLEVDYIPGVIGPKDFSTQLDYTIGSVHFVDQLPDGTRWEIDGQHTFFLEGFETIFKSNIRDTVCRYLELTREMITKDCPTIVGHLDKLKIQNIDEKLFREQDNWYQQEIKKTLDTLVQSGAILEVNTRGIYQKKSATTYPSAWVLEYALQKKIQVTISSDAHHPDDLTNNFTETAAMLEQIGFRKISILHEGSWQPFSFNAHGIIHA